jgi:transaldolase
MRLFIDTASIREVRDAARWGVVAGATTNPKILSSEGSSFELRDRVLEIAELVQGPVSVEVVSETPEQMLVEARTYASWHPSVVVKIPMGIENMAVASTLEREGIATNVTALMTVSQAVLASLAGATYASLFFGRISDLGVDPSGVIREAAQLLHPATRTQIIVGSIRNLMDVNRSFLAGADIVTVPYGFLKQMAHHPKTVETIQEFNLAWAKSRNGAPEKTPASATSPALAALRRTP